jgi:hypothetical protein
MNRLTAIAYIDMLLCLLVAFVLIVANLNTTDAKQTDEQARTPGNIAIFISWPAERDCDVDLWVRAPGDVSVGYSRKNGKVFDLLRDDLGHTSDPVKENFETAFSRGTPAGEWAVTLHPYRLDGLGAVPVHVVAQIIQNGKMETLWTADVMLAAGGETTVRQFTLNGQGSMTSQNTLPITLRSAGG